MRDTAAEFFNLPLEEKNKYATQNDLQGYGHGQAFAVSKKKTLDWTDCLMLFIYPSAYRNPKDAIEAYSAGVNKVGERLLSALSVLMGMNKDTLQEMHEGVMHVLRMNYYPTCSMPDEVLGVSPHSDASSLTILMQDVAGLQIRHDGGWVSVNPIPNALVVNIGDALEVFKYKI
ncbi:hypothetical protein AQUCO_00300129v1 [Aquilegia coerulea]|uniref:Fe2OG dioxygenase domain-containing protein n=1 Tax=Aquilegia coerulea TaxID=218851 RepID=A0A2G5EXB7_AQUCA|nr:hypothetical protein AQUCO_00300129v1 [Aquilegia coerulea]